MRRVIKLTFFLLMCFFCTTLKAQQKHFVYIQSEDKQPFAIVMNGKVYSSSDYGYIILPKLVDSMYKFTVSFPLNKFPDQPFTYTVNKKDAGFILKNNNNSWALQDMQTQKIVANNNVPATQSNTFGNMLSDVVSDSNLAKNSTPANANAGDTITAQNTIANGASALNNPVASIDTTARLQKISEAKLDTGTVMSFIDKTQNGTDTIHVFVPSGNNNATSNLNAPVITGNKTNNISSDSSLQNTNSITENTVANNVAVTNSNETNQQTSNPFYKAGQNNANAIAQPQLNASAVTVNKAIKEDCINMISDDDVARLKRKMFSQRNDNNMIQYALKSLNRKCITTDQVKSIGTLFTSDDGRYNVYDALYKYVYDYGNYANLSSQILDPYYKKRFAAMLR